MVRTSRTFTLNCFSIAPAISILLASLATTKVYAPCLSSCWWDFSVTSGLTRISLTLRMDHLLRGNRRAQRRLLDHQLARLHHVVRRGLGEGQHLHVGEVAERAEHRLVVPVRKHQHPLGV